MILLESKFVENVVRIEIHASENEKAEVGGSESDQVIHFVTSRQCLFNVNKSRIN